MWVARFKISGEKGSIGSRAKKFNICISGYPISTYETKDGLYIYIIGFIFGKEKNKKAFIKDIKKGEKTIHFENKGDFIIAQIKEKLKFKPMYSHKLINIKPIIIDEQGINHWTVGSWNKKDLINFLKVVEKEHEGKLISIKKEKIKDFSFIHIQPELTDKQKQAMNLAIKNNYYDYPRKTSIEKLAKLSNLSFSTFHAHLRKAEQKLLPFFFAK